MQNVKFGKIKIAFVSVPKRSDPK